MYPFKKSSTFWTNCCHLTFKSSYSEKSIINLLSHQFNLVNKKKKKRPKRTNNHSSRIRKISKLLNVSPESFPKEEIDPSAYKQSFYDKAIATNQIPIACQNRESQLNESKKRYYWNRNCYQNFSTIIIADSQGAAFQNTNTVLDGTCVTAYSGLFQYSLYKQYNLNREFVIDQK